MATKTLTVSENVSYICFPPLNAKTVKGKLAFDCPVVHLYFGFTPTFDIEPKKKSGLNFCSIRFMTLFSQKCKGEVQGDVLS